MGSKTITSFSVTFVKMGHVARLSSSMEHYTPGFQVQCSCTTCSIHILIQIILTANFTGRFLVNLFIDLYPNKSLEKAVLLVT